MSLLAARFEIIKELRNRYPFVEEGVLLSKLIAYCSKEAHSSVEKACMIGLVKLRILETDKRFRLRGDTLKTAVSVCNALLRHTLLSLKLKKITITIQIAIFQFLLSAFIVQPLGRQKHGIDSIFRQYNTRYDILL